MNGDATGCKATSKCRLQGRKVLFAEELYSRLDFSLAFSDCKLTVYSDVCTKYQEAAKIVNLALQGLVSQCVPGGTILDICEFGQTIITTQSAKLYTKKVNGQVVDRGVAFPVCISVNDIVCNHSPLPNEERVSAVPCGIEKNGVPAVQNNLWWSTQVCHDCLPTVSLKTIPFISSPLSTERRRKGGL